MERDRKRGEVGRKAEKRVLLQREMVKGKRNGKEDKEGRKLLERIDERG